VLYKCICKTCRLSNYPDGRSAAAAFSLALPEASRGNFCACGRVKLSSTRLPESPAHTIPADFDGDRSRALALALTLAFRSRQ
jgi:hypothetical protein